MSKHSARGRAWDSQKERVLERDGWTCSACGNWLASDHHDPRHDATVDHIAPVSAEDGREYRDDELTSMCRSCNSRKGARPLVRRNWTNPRWLPNGLPS